MASIRKKLVACIISILLFPAIVFAAGNAEKGLPKVDRLIRERNYNEAILELTYYLQENPDDFDNAQRRIQRIVKMRENYNDVAGELLGVLTDEPTNDEKKLAMIQFLESLEKNPNLATQDFIAQTKSAAQFTYYRAKFDEIMSEGNALIDSASYLSAARVFTTGYPFYKAEFDEANAGTDLLAQADEKLNAVSNALLALEALQLNLNNVVTAYISAVQSGNPAATQTALTAVQDLLSQYALSRNALIESGWFFEDAFLELRAADPLLTENSFLPFAWRFTMGRRTGGRFEGVAGAIDAQWNNAMDRMQRATDDSIRQLWLSTYNRVLVLEAPGSPGASAPVSPAAAAGPATTAVPATTVISSAESLAAASRIAEEGRRLAGLSALFIGREEMILQRPQQREEAKYLALQQLVNALAQTALYYSDYLTVRSALASYRPDAPLASSLTQRAVPVIVTYDSFVSRLEGLTAAINGLPVPPAAAASGDYFSELARYREIVLTAISESRAAAHTATAVYRSQGADALLTARQNEYQRGQQLQDGVLQADGSTVFYYPTESVTALATLRSGIAADRVFLQQHRTALLAVSENYRSRPDFAAALVNLERVIADLDGLTAGSAALISRANARISEANVARGESDFRYNQALGALRQNNFQGARDNLQRSRDSVLRSLALQESATLRAESDRKLQQLGADINRIENEFVVREVRALINSGKNFYYAGNFDQAEQVLIQARTRWAVTNIEPNGEVTNWLSIINTALSVKTGRTIPVSDPLYPEMSQILNIANQLYAEGRRQTNAGQRAAGVRTLNQAKDKLRQLQLVYPLNQDAGQLTLLIDQLIDPEAFETLFRQKMENARSGYRGSDSQTAYSDLLDLYKINPSFPGLKALLDTVEIYLGIKIPPPDPRALARSAELTRSAQRIYDANSRAQFPTAIAQLDEAIKLNPDNQSAILLKDRLGASEGGTAVAVLSTAAEELYQRALREYQNRNTIIASALVAQLLQDPKNRNSAKILELKRRIDAQQ